VENARGSKGLEARVLGSEYISLTRQVTVCCSVLQCVLVRCGVLQCSAVSIVEERGHGPRFVHGEYSFLSRTKQTHSRLLIAINPCTHTCLYMYIHTCIHAQIETMNHRSRLASSVAVYLQVCSPCTLQVSAF